MLTADVLVNRAAGNQAFIRGVPVSTQRAFTAGTENERVASVEGPTRVGGLVTFFDAVLAMMPIDAAG